MIQQGINQALSLAGVLAGMNPALQERRSKILEGKKLTAEEQAITSARDIAAHQADYKEAEQYQEDLSTVKKKQFELSPSTESYQAYVKTKTPKGDILPGEEGYEQELLKQAEAEAALRSEQRRLHESRLATLGISDKPTYPVRTETEPSGYQRSFPLTTAEREPMHPELQRKGGKR